MKKTFINLLEQEVMRYLLREKKNNNEKYKDKKRRLKNFQRKGL
jgi:hypothetical protein